MKFLVGLRELTVSELLSIAVVFIAPIAIGYSILT